MFHWYQVLVSFSYLYRYQHRYGSIGFCICMNFGLVSASVWSSPVLVWYRYHITYKYQSNTNTDTNISIGIGMEVLAVSVSIWIISLVSALVWIPAWYWYPYGGKGGTLQLNFMFEISWHSYECLEIVWCVSSRCLEGVWKVSGGFLERVLLASGGYDWDVSMVLGVSKCI